MLTERSFSSQIGFPCSSPVSYNKQNHLHNHERPSGSGVPSLFPPEAPGCRSDGDVNDVSGAEGSVGHHAWSIVPHGVLLAWEYSAGHRAPRMSRVRTIRPDHTSVRELLRRGRDDSGMSKRKRQAMLTSLRHQGRGHQGGAGNRVYGAQRGLFTAEPQLPEQSGTENL